VHLTLEGKKLITRAYNRHAADMEELASDLSASERTTLIRLLKKIGYRADAEVKQKTTNRAA
jgi:DNA-binding MarR family transcriptional regulator